MGVETRHKSDPGEDVSDELLLDRHLKGDTHALPELLERYRKPLYGFLWRMTESAVESDEIFQETWLRIIRKAADFRQDRFKGWMFKIAHNLVTDWRRQRGRTISLDGRADGEEGQATPGDFLADKDGSPYNKLEDKELRSEINKALSHLPTEQREVFVLRMESNMAFKDIAKLQDTSINTVLSRMQYALSKLRTLLKDHGPDGKEAT